MFTEEVAGDVGFQRDRNLVLTATIDKIRAAAKAFVAGARDACKDEGGVIDRMELQRLADEHLGKAKEVYDRLQQLEVRRKEAEDIELRGKALRVKLETEERLKQYREKLRFELSSALLKGDREKVAKIRQLAEKSGISLGNDTDETLLNKIVGAKTSLFKKALGRTEANTPPPAPPKNPTLPRGTSGIMVRTQEERKTKR